MAVNKEFMGRIFLCPERFSPPDQGPQFWVNIGFNTHGNQIFPAWVAEMESAASKDDYDAMIKDLKDYFDSSAPSMGCVMASLFCGACVCLVWNFERGMHAVAAQHTHRFRGGLIILRKDMSMPVANVPGEQSKDQYGAAPVSSGRGRSKAMWPPLGYNVILQAPRERGAEVRATWPPGAAPATNTRAAVPAQLSIPVRELTIPSAVVQGAGVAAGARAGGPIFCGGCGDALGGSKFCKECGTRAGM